MNENRTAPGAEVRRSSPVRILGLTFDRLTFRLSVGIALLIILPLTVGLYVLAKRQFERGIEAHRRAAASENRVLEIALRHQMIDRDPTLLSAALREVASRPEVLDIVIVNHDGEVRISSRDARVGERFSKDSPTCRVCHAIDPEERSRWVRFDGEQGEVLRTVQPIENRPECHRCHDPGARYNGMLLMDISLGALRSQLSRDLALVVAGAGMLALLLLAGVGLFVRYLILRRLARFSRVSRSMAAGNFSERVPTDGDDVITSLAGDFNEMARSVNGLVDEVQQREAQLTSVMNSLEDGLVVLDRDGRVMACNRSFSRRMNIPPEKLRASRCHEAAAGTLPCCQERHECPASRCMATGTVQRGIFRVAAPTGEVRRVEEVYASPVFGGDGGVVQVVELWRDITERVKEEEHLAEIERMVSLGVLASGFSHEVNTPLASMLTCAESVIARIEEIGGDGVPPDLLPSILEAATQIRQQVLRCSQTTEQFLRFSRGIPPSIEPMDLGQRLAEVVSLVTPTARENGVEVRLELPARIPMVHANAEVVQHVVLNLLVNAIQSCAPGGGRIELAVESKGDVRILVSDSGCGIPAEDRRHLFEPFRSRKPRGTGLGLFLSRMFMRRFGGDVRLVDSALGVGSRFEVVFRFAEESAS